MVQNIFKPMSSHNYGTPVSEAGNLPVQPYTTSTNEPSVPATQYTINSSATSVQALAADETRNVAIFINNSTAICYLGFGFTPTTTSYTVSLAANGGMYTLTGQGSPTYNGVVNAIWASANGTLVITKY